MFKNAQLEIKPVSENPLQAFYTDKFQLYDIIEIILSQLPYCNELTMTSFSISEEFIRKIHRQRKEFNPGIVNIFLDTKAAAKVQKLNLFLKNTFNNVYLSNNHGKVLIFDSNPHVSICTSQNQTRGNRKESHIITTDENVYNTFFAAISKMKKNALKL